MLRVKSIVFFILLAFFLTSLTRNLLEYYKNLSFHEDYRQEYEKEKYRNQTLKTQILKEKDPNEIEKTIRNKLNLSQPNEVVVMVPSPTPTPTIVIIPTVPVYKEWAHAFFRN